MLAGPQDTPYLLAPWTNGRTDPSGAPPFPDARIVTATESSPASWERLFIESLPVVDRLLAIIAKRHSLATADADEFAAWARGRLMDDGYAILRKFGGRSSLATYLSVVLSNLFRDFRNARWGRWRPSAAATRLGPTGIRLDELLNRDGCSLREAVGILHSAGVTLTEGELTRMASRLPAHSTHREVDLARAEAEPARQNLTGLTGERDRLNTALDSALSTLSDQDRIITRMRYWDGTSIADIARTLHIDQKPLYRRFDDIQRRLRTALERHGISEALAREVLVDEEIW